MRTTTRLGVTAATITLGASAALAGAGVASAAVVTRHDNSVSVSGKTVSVTNKEGTTLLCSGVYTTERLAKVAYTAAVKGEEPSNPGDVIAALEAMSNGKLASVSGAVEAGKTQALTMMELSPVPVVSGLEAVVTCSDGTNDYVMRTGGGGILGSLDIGGSLGDITGSLGS